jgi:hypothetical protein
MTDEAEFADRAKRSLQDYGPGDACTICDAPVEGFGHCLHCGQKISDPVTCTNCGRSVLRAGVCFDCINHEPEQEELL